MGAQNFERKTRHLGGVLSLTVFGPNLLRRWRASALVKPIEIVAVAAVFETSIVVPCTMPLTNRLLRQTFIRVACADTVFQHRSHFQAASHRARSSDFGRPPACTTLPSMTMPGVEAMP